jgi:GDP-L-fucose synthase
MSFSPQPKVGGIFANNRYPAEFISEDLAIQTNVVQAARQTCVKRLLFLGSSCIYPRDCPQPIHMEHMASSSGPHKESRAKKDRGNCSGTLF